MHLFTKTIAILRKVKNEKTNIITVKKYKVFVPQIRFWLCRSYKKKEPNKKKPNTPPPKKKPSIKKGEHLLDFDFKVMRFSGIFIQRKR